MPHHCMRKNSLLIFIFLATTAFAQNPKIADSLLRLVHTASSDSARSSLYCKLAVLPAVPKEKAIAWADSAIKQGNASGDVSHHAAAFKAKGDVFYRRSENDTALHYYSEALKLYVQANDLTNQAMCEYAIGSTLNACDRYPEALNAFMECEKTAERAGSKRYQAYGKNGIGTIYFQTKQYAASEKAHREALEIALEVKDNKLLGWTYTNIGNVYITQKKYEDALKYFQLQLEAYSQTDFISGQAGALNNIGVCNSYMGKYDEAIVNYERAAELKQKIDAAEGVSIAYQNIAELYALKNDSKAELEYAYKSLEWANNANSLTEIAASYHQLAQGYASQKRFDSAYSYFVKFKETTDSIYDQKTLDQVTEMQAKYDNEKQQEQITLLQKDNKIGQLYNYVFAALGCLVFLLSLFIYSRYRLKNKANKLLAEQNEQITSQKKEITDSINYAKRIQQSILPSPAAIANFFPENFVLYRPKDIVSGDFYWMERIGDKTLFATVDCTGHGVPGAMMSVLGYNLLTEAVLEKKLSTPSEILNSLNHGIIRALQRQSEGQIVKDGMDITLCAFDSNTMQLEFAGVYNPLYHVRKGELKILDADRQALGEHENTVFKNQVIDLEKGDCIYFFTDGYADQFGGPHGKKFKYKQLQQLILSIAELPMKEQIALLERKLDEWKGPLEQVDDILLFGFRV